MSDMKKLLQIMTFLFLFMSIMTDAYDSMVMKITPASLDIACKQYRDQMDTNWYVKKAFQGSRILFMSCVVLSFASYGYTYMSDIDQAKKDREIEKYTKYTTMCAIIAANSHYQRIVEKQQAADFFKQYQDRLLEMTHFMTGFGLALIGSIGGTLLADYLENNIQQLESKETIEGFVRSQTHIYEMYSHYQLYKLDVAGYISPDIFLVKANLWVRDIHKLLACAIYQLDNRSDIQDAAKIKDFIEKVIIGVNEIADLIDNDLQNEDRMSLPYDERLHTLISSLPFLAYCLVQDLIFLIE